MRRDYGEIEFCPKEMTILSEPKYTETITNSYKPDAWPELSVVAEKSAELRNFLPGAKKVKTKQQKQVRLDHSYEHVNLFELPSFLSAPLCTHLIEQSEAMQYSNIKAEYDVSYREADRVIVMCEPLARLIWDKLRQSLKRDDVFEIMPYGFGSAGVWAPVGINPCMRFTRYSIGHHFKPHKDGMFVMTSDYRTIYTVVIYLNDGFEGGQTEFYTTEVNQDISDYETLKLKKEKELCPQTGKAVVFNHDTLHSATSIVKGTKYILRTDILFQRVSFSICDTLHFLKDPLYVEAEKHYQLSIQLKAANEPDRSTREFLKGLQIQAQLVSVKKKPVRLAPYAQLPSDSWMHLFFNCSAFLSRRPTTNQCHYHTFIVSLLSVCHSWFYQLTEGALWKHLYELYFGLDASEKNDRANEVTDMWFYLFKDRFLSERYNNTMVVDLGNMSVKYLLMSRNEEHIIPSVFVHYYGHLWNADQGNYFHMGWEIFMQDGDYERTESIRERYEYLRTDGTWRHFADEFKSNYNYVNVSFISDLPEENEHFLSQRKGLAFFLTELTSRFFDEPVHAKQTPLAIMRSYHYNNKQIEVADSALKNRNVKNVTWLSPCVCALGYFKKTSGIVIDIGAKYIEFGIAHRGKEIISFANPFHVRQLSVSSLLVDYCLRFPIEKALDENLNLRIYFFDEIRGGFAEDSNSLGAGKPLDWLPLLVEGIRLAFLKLESMCKLSASEQEDIFANTYIVGGRSFYFEKEIVVAFTSHFPTLHVTFPEKEERIMCGVRGAKRLLQNKAPLESMLKSNTRIYLPESERESKEKKKNCLLM